MRSSRRNSSAFTLVEILIVVIVVGILAAIVVPQFSEANTDSQTSALQSNLRTIRAQLELYKLQHKETYPAFDTFTAQMTSYTKETGEAKENKDATNGYILGPYLMSIPNNPFTKTNTVGADDSTPTAWYYNATTGQFKSNDGDATREGY